MYPPSDVYPLIDYCATILPYQQGEHEADKTILQRIRVMDSWPAQSGVGQESDDGELSSSEESERASMDSGKVSLIGH